MNGVVILVAFAAIKPETMNEWLDRTAMLESRWQDDAIGDKVNRHGKPNPPHKWSRGRYQIRKPTWEAYSKQPWRTAAHDPVESRRVCVLILRDCAKACRRDGKPVTFENVRWYYRHGKF